MARTRKVGLDQLAQRRRGYLLELIKRDPLTQDFLKFPHFNRLYSAVPDVQRDYWKFQDQLEAKWGVIVRPLPPPPNEVPEALFSDRLEELRKKQLRDWDEEDLELYCDKLFSKGVRPTTIAVKSAEHPIRYTVNDSCVTPALEGKLLDPPKGRCPKGFWSRGTTECLELARGRLTAGWDGFHCRPCFGSRTAVLDQAHSVTISVNLAQVTVRNLEDLAKEFKQILRHVLQFASNAPHAKLTDALDFLRTVSPMRFAKALRVYDLHMVQGLGFAAIARLKGVGPSANQVERAVKLLYRAIYRAPYTARRRRLDTPAQGEPEYRCPQHYRDCPKNCQHMRDWWKRVSRTLPTDYSGIGQFPERARKPF